jgi:G3E family GTPase
MIDIYLITGFLGSGKTTLMKNLMRMFKNDKVAMIVNEFGQEGVDGSVLKKEGMVIDEIIDGSIFCVCRTDKFIESILKTKELDVDYLIVESSGLADPFGMPAVMEVLNKLAPMNFHYSGSVCLVDANIFFKVYDMASTVTQQIQEADLLIINKTDISTLYKIEEIEKTLRQLNTYAEIIKTSFSRVPDTNMIYSLQWHNPDMKGIIITKTVWVSKFVLKFDMIPIEQLVDWLREWSEDVYRIKGFCGINNRQYYIQAVGKNIVVSDFYDERKENFLVVLGPARDNIKENIRNSWFNRFKTNIQINVYSSK